MTVKELASELKLHLLTQNMPDREISGCYIGDMLSWVMANAKADNVWITIQSNMNVVAVASLNDLACVIIAEGAECTPDIVHKANEEDVVLFASNLNSYQLAAQVSKLLD